MPGENPTKRTLTKINCFFAIYKLNHEKDNIFNAAT